MSSDFTYEKFLCAFSNETHFVRDPVLLKSCEHSVCNNCLMLNAFNCKLCGKAVEIKDDDKEIALEVKEALKNNLDNLYELLEKQTATSLTKLEGNCYCVKILHIFLSLFSLF